MIIAISGVSTTGKSTASKLLAKKLNFKLVDLHDLAEKIHAFIGYDKERKSKIVSVYKLKKEIKKLSKKNNLIIEGIFAHEFKADYCIIFRCDPRVLEKRLKKRFEWPTKIYENLEIERFGLITQEALDYNKNVFEIDITKKTPRQIVRSIEEILKGEKEKYKPRKIG